jgi:serine/threonine protein kinase/WD40 repeat protein
VVQLLEGYLEQLERGTPPPPDEWLAEHPGPNGPLEECLATLELLHQTALSMGRGSPSEAILTPKEPDLGRLGDFRLVREVGRGGMGTVYEAEQVSLRRQVALKVLPLAGALDARQRQRFHNEALTASQLHHAHIVDVFGAGCERGVHYYAMRYIEGQTLAQLIDRMRKTSGLEATDTPKAALPDTCSWYASQDASEPELADQPAGEARSIPPALPETITVGGFATEGSGRSLDHCRAAAAIAGQVAEALDYAHEHGVVHRDIKPSNVMLDSQGQAWIADFGLAHLQRQAHLTQSGDLVGTLRYMSPEQAQARRDIVDHRTDIYSLGATLYELLTLQPAVPGEEREEILHRLTFEEVVWPSRLNPAIPPDLEAIVLKAMAKAPGERYVTAQELAEDLRRFGNDQAVLARRPTRLQRAGKWARRHRWPLLAVAGAFVLILTLTVALLALSNVHFREALTLTDLRAQEQQARAAEREKTLQLAMARWREARMIRQSRQPGQRFRSLKALEATVGELRSLGQLDARRAELRDDALACLTLWDVHAVSQLPVAPLRPLPAIDPLGRHCAAAEAANVVSWRRLSDGEVVHRWPWEGSHCIYLTVSPAARYVAALCLDDQQPEKAVCRVWDSGTGRPVREFPASYRCGHDFRRDDKVLALAQADGSIALYDLDTGRDLPPLPAGPLPEHLRFHPGGQYLAVSFYGHPDVVVWDLAARKVVLRLAGERYRGGPAWSADGSLLAVGSTDTNIYVCTFPGGSVQAVLLGHEHIVTGVEFHPSGRLLASTSHDDTTRLWCVAPGGGRLGERIAASADGTAPLWNFSPGGELVLPGEKLLGFSRDGRRLFTRSFEKVTAWELADPEDCLHYLHYPSHGPGRGTGPWEVAFSPDGLLLASASRDGVLLWDPAAARRVGPVLPSGDGYALAFHPKGDRLFTTGNGGVMEWPIVPQRFRVAPDPRSGVLIGWPIVPGRDAPLLHVGPGTLVRATTSDSRSRRIDLARTGESLLLGAGDGEVDVLSLTKPGQVRRLGTHEGLFGVALSPDGRWAVTAGHQGNADRPEDALRIWDVAQGLLVRRLPHEGEYPGAAFSPDGRWLVTGVRSAFFFWEVGSWELKAQLPREPRSLFCSVAFARDAGLLALAQDRNHIHLHDAVTLRQLARLQVPGPVDLTGLSLSPDGTRLAAATQQDVVVLWDLRRLRQELAALDLDWEMPPYPPAKPVAEAAWVLTVEVLPADKIAPR